MNQVNKEKIKVLALGDYCCSTGFGTVMSNIMQNLNNTGKYDLDVIGINYTGDPYNVERFPGKVYPAQTIANMFLQDPYGRQKVLEMLASGKYEILFILQDTFIVQTFIKQVLEVRETLKKKFKIIFYFPLDAIPKKDWITDCVSLVDYPVTYTKYAAKLIVGIDPYLGGKLKIIYHGTNFKDFNYIEDRKKVAEFRKQYFSGKADGRFLLTNVNRNQIRKDPIRNFMLLDELKRRGKRPILYLHMSHEDVGGNLLVMADNFGLKLQEDYILPSPRFFSVNQGIPVEALNLIYNASDALISTTLGEGWGLSITEAMAAKTPIIAPDNTSLHEMLADNRGKLVKSGSNPSLWITLGSGDNERMRPLTDVEDMADKVLEVMDGKLPDIEGAYKWARSQTWEDICKAWIEVFDQAYFDLHHAPRAERRRLEKAARK